LVADNVQPGQRPAGGIPVIQRGDGSLVGVDAVIDKDHASALPARMIGADRLGVADRRRCLLLRLGHRHGLTEINARLDQSA
jgi:carbamate kinase